MIQDEESDDDDKDKDKAKLNDAHALEDKIDKIGAIRTAFKHRDFDEIPCNIPFSELNIEQKLIANRFNNDKSKKKQQTMQIKKTTKASSSKYQTDDASDSDDNNEEDFSKLNASPLQQYQDVFKHQKSHQQIIDDEYARLYKKTFNDRKQAFQAIDLGDLGNIKQTKRNMQALACVGLNDKEFFLVTTQYVNKSKTKKNDFKMQIFKVDQEDNSLMSDAEQSISIGNFDISDQNSKRRTRLNKIPFMHPSFCSFQHYGSAIYFFGSNKQKEQLYPEMYNQDIIEHLPEEISKYITPNGKIRIPDDIFFNVFDSENNTTEFDDGASSASEDDNQDENGAENNDQDDNKNDQNDQNERRDRFSLYKYDLITGKKSLVRKFQFPVKKSKTGAKLLPISIVFEKEANADWIIDQEDEADVPSIMKDIKIAIVYRGEWPSYQNGAISFRKLGYPDEELIKFTDTVDLRYNFNFSSFKSLINKREQRDYIGVNYWLKNKISQEMQQKFVFKRILNEDEDYDEVEKSIEEKNQQKYLHKNNRSNIEIQNYSSVNLVQKKFDEDMKFQGIELSTMRSESIHQNLKEIAHIINPSYKANEGESFLMHMDYLCDQNIRYVYLFMFAESELIVYKGILGNLDKRFLMVYPNSPLIQSNNTNITRITNKTNCDNYLEHREGLKGISIFGFFEGTQTTSKRLMRKFERVARQEKSIKFFMLLMDQVDQEDQEIEQNTDSASRIVDEELKNQEKQELLKKQTTRRDNRFVPLDAESSTKGHQFTFDYLREWKEGPIVNYPTIIIFKDKNIFKRLENPDIDELSLWLQEAKQKPQDNDFFFDSFLQVFRAYNQAHKLCNQCYYVSTQYTNLIRDSRYIYYKIQDQSSKMPIIPIKIKDNKHSVEELKSKFIEIEKDNEYQLENINESILFWSDRYTSFKKQQTVYVIIPAEPDDKFHVKVIPINQVQQEPKLLCRTPVIQFIEDKNMHKPFITKHENGLILFIIDIAHMRIKASQMLQMDNRGARIEVTQNSVIYQQDDDFCQNFQVLIQRDSYFIIFEYKAIWSKGDDKPAGEVELQLRSKKVIVQSSERQIDEFALIPMIKEKSMEICGSQIVMNTQHGKVLILQMKNFGCAKNQVDVLSAESFISENGYKRYSSQGSADFKFLLVESHLKDKHYADLDQFDKQHILRQQCNTLLNMIPNDINHRVLMNPNKSNFSPIVPIEALQGYTIVDFLLHDPKQIEKELKEQAKAVQDGLRDDFSHDSMYTKILIIKLIGSNKDRKHYFQKHGFLRSAGQISKDFNLQNIVQRCLRQISQERKKYFQLKMSSELIIKKILAQGYQMSQFEILMQAFGTLTQCLPDTKIKGFAKFFITQDYMNDDSATISMISQFKDQENLPQFSKQGEMVQYISDIGLKETSISDVEGFLKDQINKLDLGGKVSSGREQKISNTYIDFRAYNMHVKIDNLFSQHINEENSQVLQPMSRLYLAHHINIIIQQDSDDIELQDNIKHIINYQFEESLRLYSIYIILALVQLIAFLVQVQKDDHEPSYQNTVFVCNLIQLIVGFIFFLNEIIIIQFKGADFSKIWVNLIQSLTFAITALYFGLRTVDARTMIPNIVRIISKIEEEPDDISAKILSATGLSASLLQRMTAELCKDPATRRLEDDFEIPEPVPFNMQFIMTVLNMVLAILLAWRFIDQIRISETFGILVTLMQKVMVEVGFFLIFFFFWIMLFAFIFMILGMELAKDENGEPEDFNGVHIVVQYFLQTYRNSIGDIAPPVYDFWLQRKENQTTVWNEFLCDFMIGIIIFSWLINQFVVFIVLMNFMIAIISQSYEDIQSEKQQVLYMQRAEFNFNCQLVLDRIGKLFMIKRLRRTEEISMLTVSGQAASNEPDQTDVEWDGMAIQVKKSVNKLLGAAFRNIDSNVNQLSDELKEIKDLQISQDKEFTKVTSAIYRLIQLQDMQRAQGKGLEYEDIKNQLDGVFSKANNLMQTNTKEQIMETQEKLKILEAQEEQIKELEDELKRVKGSKNNQQ